MNPSLTHGLSIAAANSSGLVVVLTGAGISAESGIPTFRGQEGYWTVGARDYHPQEMATHRAFEQMPRDVWHWYLYRRTICHQANANAGHLALVELEAQLGDDFLLVTQNVDGLHRRAGQSAARTFEVHGNIDRMRCDKGCSTKLIEIPATVPLMEQSDPLSDAIFTLLRCPDCGGRARPHVLWFDESYDEVLFRFESALEASTRASLLVTVGTSGATNLPSQMVAVAAERCIPIIDINPNDNPFGQVATQQGGAAVQVNSAIALPPLVAALLAARK